MADKVGLTPEEKNLGRELAAVWNSFALLNLGGDPQDNQEFAYHIRACQAILGTRVARRADPNFWVIHRRDR